VVLPLLLRSNKLARHDDPLGSMHNTCTIAVLSICSKVRVLDSTYSITSLARSRIDCGMVRSSVLAVLILMISSYLSGAWTGRSEGFSPRPSRRTQAGHPKATFMSIPWVSVWPARVA
jgi:hypothetical protein